MSTFQAHYLSDEDVAHLLSVCTTRLLLTREKGEIQVWICPTCGREMRLCQPARVPSEHLRPEYANWV